MEKMKYCKLLLIPPQFAPKTVLGITILLPQIYSFFNIFSLTASNGRKNYKLSTCAIIRSAEYEFYCRLHLKFANGFILHRNIIYLSAFTLKTHPSRQLRTILDQTFAEDHHRQGHSQPTRTLKRTTSRDKLVVACPGLSSLIS